jgi:signal peptidase I
MSTAPEALKRRDFLKTSSLAAISAAALATGAASAPASAGAQGSAQPAEAKPHRATGAPEPLGPRTTFHALDYHRPGFSDADVIQAAIDAAIASGGPAEVVLENKIYRIDRTIKIHQTRDLTLEGNGALLLMTKYVMAINVHDCTKVRLANMTFDYDPLPFTQGEVVKVDPKAMTWDLKIDDGYPCNDGFLDALRSGYSTFLLVDVRQRRAITGSFGPSVAGVEVVGPRVVRFTDRSRPFVEALVPGDVIVIKPWQVFGDREIVAAHPKKFAKYYTIYHWQHSVIHLVNTEACETERLTFHTGPSALYEFAGKGGNRHLKNVVRPGPRPDGASKDRQTSVILDVFESVSTERGPLVEDWVVDQSGDDAIVLFGLFSNIVHAPGSGVVLVTPMYRNILAKGDTVEIRDSDDTVKGVARVTGLRPVNRPDLADRNRELHLECLHPFPWTPESFLELTLDHDIPSQPGDRIIALNRRCQGTVIRRNRIRGNRANGMRIQAANVLIENNEIEHVTMSGIKLSLDRQNLMMGAPLDNIVIRGNRIKGTSLVPVRDPAAVGMHAAIQQLLIGRENNNRRFFSKNTSARNLTIENNLIENTAFYGILCANASQVVIRGNVIRGANQMEPKTNALGFKPDSAILVAASDHVTVENNAVTPGRYGGKDVAEFQSTSVKIISPPAR